MGPSEIPVPPQPTGTTSAMEVIPRAECLRLLAGCHVGRLGFVVGDQPMVLPVNYAVNSGVLVLRTGEGAKLDALPAKVALEIDSIDDAGRSGWSVVVQGVAEELSDDSDWFARDIRGAAVPPWAPGTRDHYVRIRPQRISGRRIPGRRPAS